MFVCNTHHTTTEDIVRLALEQCSAENGQEIVCANKITQLSREGMFRVSWRVTVNHKDKERALSAECWPEGWGVRKFNGFIREDRIQSAAPFIPHIPTVTVTDTDAVTQVPPIAANPSQITSQTSHSVNNPSQ